MGSPRPAGRRKRAAHPCPLSIRPYLPPAPDFRAMDDSPGKAGCALRMGERIKVLVVEDDGDSREVLAEILGVDFDVLTAADGLAGLEAFQSEHPDVLITDETLPGLSGTALARRVKDQSPDVRVVLVSGHAALPNPDLFDVVLRKPVDIDKLAAAVGGAAWVASH